MGACDPFAPTFLGSQLFVSFSFIVIPNKAVLKKKMKKKAAVPIFALLNGMAFYNIMLVFLFD